MLPVTGVVTPVTPEYTSKLTAKSASARMFTRFEIAVSFSMVTTKLEGASKEITNS